MSSRATSVFSGFRFPPEVISVAVRWYLRYGLSCLDVEELMAERGISVDQACQNAHGRLWLSRCHAGRGLSRHRSG